MTAPDFLDRLAAAEGLAYHFAMLDEVARRVRVLEEEHRPEPEPEMRVAREFSYWGDLTSTTSGFQAKPRLLLAGVYTSEELRDITEYRTYVEAALLLARKVSDVVSPRLSGRKTDVRLSDFPGAVLPNLDEVETGLIERIDKLAAHQTYYRGSKGWPIADIRLWAARRREEVSKLLSSTQYGGVFDTKFVQYCSQAALDGWSERHPADD